MNKTKVLCHHKVIQHFLYGLYFAKHSGFDQADAVIEHLTDRSLNTEFFAKSHNGTGEHINFGMFAVL